MTSQIVRALRILVTLTLLGLGVAAVPSGAASAAPTWAPADTATITPGVQTNTAGSGQCTANFVFTDANDNVYIGQAAHCSGSGAATSTDGCAQESPPQPLGTAVTFNVGGSILSAGTQVGAGTLAYSSWNTMIANGEDDANTCAYNDFALVKVNAADVAKVNPTVPFWGGPVGINTTGLAAGDRVYSYGNSGLRFGLTELSPKTGVALGDDPATDGWTHPCYTLTPGVPGDSGSAFLDAQGNAVGTLSTLGLAPLPASNNTGDLALELAYAQQHSGIPGLQLALGTEPFDSRL